MTRMFIFAAMMAVSFSAHASTVTLTATPGAASANLTWTVTNGAVNAQEVYRDTDSNPAGRVRIATVSASARSYTATGLTNGVHVLLLDQGAPDSDNVWVNSNAASAVPMAGSGGDHVSLAAHGQSRHARSHAHQRERHVVAVPDRRRHLRQGFAQRRPAVGSAALGVAEWLELVAHLRAQPGRATTCGRRT